MKLRKLLCLLVLGFLVLSCGVLPHKNHFEITQKPLELGVIGLSEKSIHKTDFVGVGVPNYENLVKVSLIEKEFTKKTYNQYLKAIKTKQVLNAVNYVDSLEFKPKYFEIHIEDKVEVVRTINANVSLFNYLKSTPRAKLITGLRFVSSKAFEKNILQADAFYMVTDNQKKERIYMYKSGLKIAELLMHKNDVFGYETASFCWKVTDRKKIKIATIIASGERCGVNTRKNANELEEELTKSTFKF